MITCVKKLSITGVRVLSFLVNSFEKLFLSQDTFFKITILIFSMVLSNLFFDLQSTYALKPTPTLSVSLLSNSNIELHSNDILSKPNHAVTLPMYLNVKTNNPTGTGTYVDVEKTAFTDIHDSSNTSSISMISSGVGVEHLADFEENTFAGSFDCEMEHPEREPEEWDPLDLASGSVHDTHYGISSGNETLGNNICFAIGIKLGHNLPTGTYQNKVIFSTVTNEYPTEANLVKGKEFQSKISSLLSAPISSKYSLEHFKRSTASPAENIPTVHLEIDETSDRAVLAWLDKDTKTIYYYSEADKLYLNPDCEDMFSYSGYRELDLRPFDASKVTNMKSMFSNQPYITEINFSNFNTSNVTNMGRLFYKNWISKLDLSSFDTSNTWFMGNMFKNTHELKKLDLHNFNTQTVTHMQYMFYNSGVPNLDLSNFNTSKVKDMKSMFGGIRNIEELNLSNFDTSNVENMSNMFNNTEKLKTLDISNFNTSNVTDFSMMFGIDRSLLVDKLERIYVKQDFDTSAGTDFTNIFTGRTNLRGGNGSFLPDPSTADKTWLRIDDPANGHPGYFTRKP